MPCDNNVVKGKEAVLLARDDLDTKWQVIGGVQSRDNAVDNPVEETTSSSTPGSYTESEYTGYSTDTMSISGVADVRTGIMVTINGQVYEVAPISRLDQLANTGNRCGKFKLIYPYKEKEGTYTITNYSDSGATPGLLNFSATLQNKDVPLTTYFQDLNHGIINNCTNF